MQDVVMYNLNRQRSRNSSKKGIKICSINICGVSHRSRMVLDKYAHDENIDILLVQESGSCDKDKLGLTNIRTFTDTNKSANRGAALYVHDSIPCTNLTELSKLSIHIDSAWGLAVINKKRYIIGSIYVKLNYNHAIKEVLMMLNKAELLSKKVKAAGVILAGDFNARHSLWGDTVNNDYGNQLVDNLDNNQFTLLTSKTPTFLCEKGSSFIDFIIVSNGLSDKLDPCYTDDIIELYSGAPLRGHVPLLTTLSENSRRSETKVEEKLDIDAINWNEWSEEIEKSIIKDSSDVNKLESPKEIWRYIETRITHANTKHGKFKKSTRHSKPYWTQKLTVLSNKMRKAREAYLQRNTDDRKSMMIETKDKFDAERKKACEEFILQKTKSLNAAECVEFWKRFNKLFKKRVEKCVDPLKSENGGLITEESEIEEELFSTFFESKHLMSGHFDDRFYDTVLELYEDIKAENEEIDLQDNILLRLNEKITIKEIQWAIKRTQCSNKSSDNHNMHPKMLHNLGLKALKLLQQLFNSCLDRGEWVWNTAEVIFLKKEGKDTYAVPGAYRPISISSYIGKLLEKILAARINAFLEANNILDPNQEGFTSRRNTIRYLNRLHLEIKTDLLDTNTVIGLFVDFEKAFDSVWKKGLIYKLSQLKIKGKVLQLIDHFLSAREVILNVNGKHGMVRSCNEYGLPQGSALSPILFKLYVLDMLEDLEAREDIRIYKFADDGTIKITNESTEQCIYLLNLVVESLKNWTRKWRMVINCQANKTEYICFGSSENTQEDIPNSIKLGDKEVKKVQETKVLGLTVDEKLAYTSHSKKVYNKLTGMWANTCKYTNKHYGFNQKVISQIIRTFFLSSLHYGGLIWMNPKNMKDIEKLWYKMIKSATGATFNIRQSVAEIILGLPPLIIQNKLNKIKHLLKLNIKPQPADTLRDYMTGCFSQQHSIPPDLSTSMKEVFKFLRWKIVEHPNDFTEREINILESQDLEQYFSLSTKACSYTKDNITKYTEKIWYQSVKNEFALLGHQYVPKPSCKRLPIPANTSRSEEVLLMSLMYPQNLFNDNVYRHTYQIASPLCQNCHQQEETPFHIIMECSQHAHEARNLLGEILSEDELQQEDYITLINGSRHAEFIKLCLTILSESEYREHIDLNE